MASRVGGTVLALTAASLFAVTLATGSWWSGHPDINGQTITLKSVHIGVLIAEGCNTGGDGACKALELGGGFNVTRYAVGGAAGLTMLSLVLVGILTMLRSDRRKLFAGITFGCAVLGMIAAIALLVQGPDLKTNAKVAVPLGWGLYVFGGAILLSITSGLVALRPLPPPPRPVLAPPGSLGPPQQQPQNVDMAALMQENALRPTADPMGRPNAMPPSPGGVLPGPSGPLGVPSSPLFQSAPQLRPLYDAAPNQGGSAGFIPQPPPPPPMRAPTPIARSQISAIAGIPTPPPLEVPPPLERPRTKSMPPPIRGAKQTAPPPMPGSRPPPSPSRPPPSSTRPPPSPTKPPMPKPSMTVPAPMPVSKIAFPPLPARQMTEDMTIDRQKEEAFDVAATRAHEKEEADADFDAAETRLPAEKNFVLSHTMDEELATQAQSSVGDHTDVNAAAAPGFAESTSPSAARFDTGEQQLVEALERDRLEAARRAATDTDVISASPKPVDVYAAALVAPNPMQAAAKAAFGPPATKLPSLPAPPPSVVSPAPLPAPPPVSTAPQSLPPPEEKPQAATSGPSPACPQCEAPMAWVEAHLRFYCRSCKMYF